MHEEGCDAQRVANWMISLPVAPVDEARLVHNCVLAV